MHPSSCDALLTWSSGLQAEYTFCNGMDRLHAFSGTSMTMLMPFLSTN